MTPYNPRIVFAAVSAFTDKITKDGRILATPEDFHVLIGSALPILLTRPKVPQDATVRVGLIEKAYVVDRRLIVFGHLDETEHGREVMDLFASGRWFLEIDIDSGDMTYDLEPFPGSYGEPVPVGPVIFKNWKLRAAHVGTEPCWDLPPVQIQEITR
jgi:hypothetical protein